MASILLLSLSIAACGGEEEDSDNNDDNNGEAVHDPVAPEQFADEFLAGIFEALYEQTSEEFKTNVSEDQFISLGEDFNEGVESYELVSEMPYQVFTEYQWLNDQGDKGIRSYFAEDLTIEGLQLIPISNYPESDKQFTDNVYRMPITEEWFTFWGGTNELVNYHYALESQRYAYDLLILKDEATFEGDPADNASYYAFGKEVVAPADGQVVAVENNIADNTPTVDTNEEEPLGNYVIIEHENDEFSVIAHFKEDSVEVSEGDEVTAGDLLGLCGNSGNSSEPHIHFHVSDSLEWETASSIRIQFEDDIDPVRGDTVTGF